MTNGFSVRAAGLLRELAEDWDLTIVAPRADGPPLPFPVAAFHETKSRDEKIFAIANVLTRTPPDAILWWQILEPSLLRDAWWSKTVLDQVDSRALTCWREANLTESWRGRLRWWRDAFAMARYERRTSRGVAATTVVGEDDARTMRRLGAQRVHVVPNGVDVHEGPRAEAGAPTVVFTGVMNYTPNVDAVRWFADAAWPAILRRCPDAKFVVGGRTPSADVLALTERDGIEVQADLPDMQAFLNRAWVAVAPMRQGAGIKNKVLEAWATGVPTVLSRIATNGLDLEGDEPWVVDGAGSWVDAVAGLLESTERRRELGESMRERARDRHGWPQAVSELRKVLDRVASEPV